jgi:rare lipoprotein A
MKRLLAVFLFCALPLSALATEPVSRRDGFLTIWQSISRPAEPAKTAFNDVPEDARGSLEIDYAAARGLIDDAEDAFRPDEPLTLGDALVWMMRFRNITDDPTEVSIESMTGLLLRYPIAHIDSPESLSAPVSSDELLSIIKTFDELLKKEEHEVSLYAEKFHGKGTAFGDTFDMYAMTAAHRSFPSNTLVKVTNVRNGKSVIVRINDRGPFVKGRDMDLSLAAFTAIEDRSKGKFMATFERLGDFRIVGKLHETQAVETTGVKSVVKTCNDDMFMQRRISGDVILKDGVPSMLNLGESLSLSSRKTFVVRKVTYPDGSSEKPQDFVFDGESFSIKPSMEGEYAFLLGTITGRGRSVRMKVVNCGN